MLTIRSIASSLDSGTGSKRIAKLEKIKGRPAGRLFLLAADILKRFVIVNVKNDDDIVWRAAQPAC